jgi:hypothetical protein
MKATPAMQAVIAPSIEQPCPAMKEIEKSKNAVG